jgi:biotin carboxyl carrier protein
LPAYEISINGKPRKVELTWRGKNSFTVKLNDKTLNIDLQAEKLDSNRFTLRIDGKAYGVKLLKIDRDGPFHVKVDEATFKAEVKTPTRRPATAALKPTSPTPTRRTTAPKQVVEGAITAPMMGTILSVTVEKGDQIEAGQVLCILEAMKMENEITAPRDGTVREVLVSEGSLVNEGETLLVID